MGRPDSVRAIVGQDADVRDEVVSVAAARTVYGVAITPDGRAVDADATARLRAAAHPTPDR